MNGEAVPPGIDTTRAHPARVYDYWLGGKDNFAADREAAEQALQAYPQLARAVQANRRFLARAVRYLTGEAGLRQFLDVGTGIPAADNTHQVAQREAPDSRIVYVDNDPSFQPDYMLSLTRIPAVQDAREAIGSGRSRARRRRRSLRLSPLAAHQRCLR